MDGIKGIDISEYNGAFDIQSAIRQGAKYVIIRCGYGSDYRDQDDKQFAANVKRCEAAGLPFGIYLYSYANTAAKAKSEAAHALRLAKICNPTWGVWFDVEDSSLPSSVAALAEMCNIFCGAMQAAGYYTGIYANANWLKNRLTDASLKKWPKWVAHFTTAVAPDYNGDDTVLWQYACPPGDKASPTAYDWNRTMKDFTQTGGSKLSRILKTGQNQITQGYRKGSHDGIDLVKSYNQLDSIVAHSAGTVTYLQKGYGNAPGSSGNASYGNLVKIKHANGYYTLYAHLDVVASGLQVGSVVTKGQTIGVMGNSGNSYGAHLHFEVRDKNDNRIDPTPYINADLPGLKTETEEEIDMTKEQTQAMIDSTVKPVKEQLAAANAELAALKKTYAFIEDVPEWYREAVQYYMNKGVIKGKEIRDGKPFLDLTATECRMVTMMYRAETDK